MNSLKQVIVNAVIKVTTDPVYLGREYPTSEDARDDFIKALIAELFPECPDCVLPSAVQASVVVAEEKDGGGEPAKEKKKRTPKAKKDAPAAAGAAEPVAQPVAEPVVEKKKPGRKPKVVEGSHNLDKWNPSQTNLFKALTKELKVEGDKKAFQEHVNAMSKEEFDGSTFEEHLRRFLTPKPAADDGAILTKCARVEWPEGSGKTYLVDPETQKVYEPSGDVNKHVGHVGMLEFEGLEIPA
jgi:hypothetical protein